MVDAAPAGGSGDQLKRRTFTIRCPEAGEAELVVSNGDHTCEVHSLNYYQLKALLLQATNALFFWPVEPKDGRK